MTQKGKSPKSLKTRGRSKRRQKTLGKSLTSRKYMHEKKQK